jgi:hypothetical protein
VSISAQVELGWHYDPAELRNARGEWTRNGASYQVPEHARLINPRGRPPDPADHPWLKANPVSPANILKVYDLSTPAEKAQGMRWYADAHDVAADMAGGDAVKGAGLLASYSPQTNWPMNMFNAARTAREGRALGPGDGMITGDMQRNAQEVLDGMPLDQALPSPKINAFAHLIQHGGDEPGDTTGHIVIDRHALSAAVGRRLTKAELDKAPLQHQNTYQYVADQYRLAAAELARRGEHIAPHQLQAITWLHQQTANEAEDAAAALEKVNRLARGRKVALGRAWEGWMKYAAGHGIEVDRGTTSLSGQLAATELAWHFDPLQPRGPDGKWTRRAQVIGPETVQARQHAQSLRARQHAHRRAMGDTWTVDENGKIIRGAHPGIHGQAILGDLVEPGEHLNVEEHARAVAELQAENAGPLTAEAARARQLKAEGRGPESIRGQLDFERNQAREAAKLKAEDKAAAMHLGQHIAGVWQFLGPHGDLKSKVGREPAKGDVARLILPANDSGNPVIIVGRVVAKAGGHAAVDAEDGNRHLIDWRNGGKPVHTIPLSQVGPALPGLGHPVAKADPDQLARFRAAQAGQLNSLGAQLRAARVQPPGLLGSPMPAEALLRPGKPQPAFADHAFGMKLPPGWHIQLDSHPPNPLAPWRVIMPEGEEFHVDEAGARHMAAVGNAEKAAQDAERKKDALLRKPEPVTDLGHASAPVQRLKALIPAVLAAGRGARSDPGGQGVQGITRLVTLPDGTKVIHKQGVSKDKADREELSYYVSQAIGAGAPALARIPDTDGLGEVQDVVPGKTAARLATDGKDPSADYELMNTPEAKQIGLLDQLISNTDRHDGNWMVSPEGKPVPIDHGQAEFDNYAYYSQFWPGRENWSAQELEQIAGQLQKTRPEFARTGHMDWYRNMMIMMRRIQTGQDFSITGQAIELGNAQVSRGVDRSMTITSQITDLSYNPAELRDSQGRWTRSGQSRAADVMMKNREGFSVSVQTGGEPAAGYMVARTGHTHTFPESVLRDHARLTKAIDQMIMSEHGSLGNGIYLGGWVHDGKLWLEPSDNFTDREQAAAVGRERNQIAIWDVSQGQEIQTGGTGGGHITEHNASGRPVRVYTESPGQGSG